MTQDIQKGFEQIFDELIELTEGFARKTYESRFMEECEKLQPLIAAIVQYCESSGDEQAALDEVASILPGMQKKALAQAGSRRKQEALLMKYNLAMVAYVIPVFRYGKNDRMERLAASLISQWNENDFSMDIKLSSYEDIQHGFKYHWCYITTAVCTSLGKPDDCYELNLLREYRDGYLCSTGDGEALVREYYDIAPTIVKRINRKKEASEIYGQIWRDYLSPCVRLIEQDKKEECLSLYTKMVRHLQKRYFEKHSV